MVAHFHPQVQWRLLTVVKKERQVDRIVATNAMLKACRGFSGTEYFQKTFPAWVKEDAFIAHFEMYALIVGLKLVP